MIMSLVPSLQRGVVARWGMDWTIGHALLAGKSGACTRLLRKLKQWRARKEPTQQASNHLAIGVADGGLRRSRDKPVPSCPHRIAQRHTRKRRHLTTRGRRARCFARATRPALGHGVSSASGQSALSSGGLLFDAGHRLTPTWRARRRREPARRDVGRPSPSRRRPRQVRRVPWRRSTETAARRNTRRRTGTERRETFQEESAGARQPPRGSSASLAQAMRRSCRSTPCSNCAMTRPTPQRQRSSALTVPHIRTLVVDVNTSR